MLPVVMLVALAAPPAECRNPPPRASSAYWTFVESCGCERLEAPPRASSDYDRFLKTCSAWRERNMARAVSPVAARPECGNPPARAASGYWDYVDACGCAGLQEPPLASSDHERYLRSCASWRERNPEVLVPTPEVSPEPGAEAAPPAPPPSRGGK